MDGLTTIFLGGKLGTLFGKEWQLIVSSPAEAIRAIDINLGGRLRRYLSTEGAKKFYRVAVGHKKNDLTKEELGNRSGQADIYILPTVRGAKSGAGKLIAAVVLAVVTYGASLYWQGAAGIGTAVTAGYTTAASLAVGGITQLLTPTPNFNQDTAGESRGSTLFNGNAVAVSQGGAVGLVYGRALVTPMPVCLSFANQDVAISSDAGNINYCRVTLEGGGFQWVPRDEDGNCPAGSEEP
mgnify:CR=1 FL=1